MNTLLLWPQHLGPELRLQARVTATGQVFGGFPKSRHASLSILVRRDDRMLGSVLGSFNFGETIFGFLTKSGTSNGKD